MKRIIIKVWNENLAELDDKVPGPKEVRMLEQYVFRSYGQQFAWNMAKGTVSQIGHVVFGEGTEFRKELEVNLNSILFPSIFFL